MSQITVYTTDFCPYCVRAKQLLDRRGITYEEINLDRDPAGRDALVAKTGRMTFPQILVDDEAIGGFTELAQADRSGRLKELTAAA